MIQVHIIDMMLIPEKDSQSQVNKRCTPLDLADPDMYPRGRESSLYYWSDSYMSQLYMQCILIHHWYHRSTQDYIVCTPQQQSMAAHYQVHRGGRYYYLSDSYLFLYHKRRRLVVWLYWYRNQHHKEYMYYSLVVIEMNQSDNQSSPVIQSDSSRYQYHTAGRRTDRGCCYTCRGDTGYSWIDQEEAGRCPRDNCCR